MIGAGNRHPWYSWIGDDLRALARLLARRETWTVIGLASVFGALGGISLYYSTGLDVSLQLRHLQTISCSSASNLQSASLIFGGAAFLLASLVAIGELANYFDDRKRIRHRASVRNVIVGSTVALVAGAGLLWLLRTICS